VLHNRSSKYKVVYLIYARLIVYTILVLAYFFFLIQQFMTWGVVADCGSYFVATYKRRMWHGVKEEEKE